jgi:hypothetical protein
MYRCWSFQDIHLVHLVGKIGIVQTILSAIESSFFQDTPKRLGTAAQNRNIFAIANVQNLGLVSTVSRHNVKSMK